MRSGDAGAAYDNLGSTVFEIAPVAWWVDCLGTVDRFFHQANATWHPYAVAIAVLVVNRLSSLPQTAAWQAVPAD